MRSGCRVVTAISRGKISFCMTSTCNFQSAALDRIDGCKIVESEQLIKPYLQKLINVSLAGILSWQPSLFSDQPLQQFPSAPCHVSIGKDLQQEPSCMNSKCGLESSVTHIVYMSHFLEFPRLQDLLVMARDLLGLGRKRSVFLGQWSIIPSRTMVCLEQFPTLSIYLVLKDLRL